MICAVENYRIKRYKNALKWNRIHKFHIRLLTYRVEELKNEVQELKNIIDETRKD